jgi:hypothetical protein
VLLVLILLAVGGMQDSIWLASGENYSWNVVFLEFRRQLQLNFG